jgi:hypothetical protein
MNPINRKINDSLRRAAGLLGPDPQPAQDQAMPAAPANPPGHAGSGTQRRPAPPRPDMNQLIRRAAGYGSPIHPLER